MKDKKAVQIAAKDKHKAELKAAKARRRGQPLLIRQEPAKEVKPVILIVCEGKNTEPSYFRQFKLASATIKALGQGMNTVTLVQRAVQLRNAGKYEQVWCVFDKDTFSAQDFNAAINLALTNGLSVAYSNQAFEYWLILHFEDHQGGGMNRNEYDETLNQYLAEFGVEYDGNGSKVVSEDIFDILLGTDGNGKRRVDVAIFRAKRNYDRFDHASPATEESSTTVFKLVEEILKYA